MVSRSDILRASILIVDDKDANISLLEQMLRGAGYVSIASTKDPREVCELYRKNRYDLILLDLQMPGMDGFQVMEDLEKIETSGYLPVLVVTAQPNHMVHALTAGAKDFVSKPFELPEVLVRVYNMLEVRLLRRKAETRSEQAIRASELSYRRLFEAAKDGILILEADTGRISDVNPFLLEMLGFSHDEMVGTPIWELGPFKDIVSNKVKFEQLQQRGYVRYEDLPLETRDGRRIAVEFVSNVYHADDRNVIQCNIRDISERKRAEKQMRGIQAQLEQTNRDLMKRSEQIQYFYHTLSHELKTPLTSAREFVSIVIDGLAGELNSTQLNYLGIAKDSCTELAVYINDLLDATRLDTGKLHIELKSVSLAAIIHRAMTIMEPAAAGKKIRLSGELDTHLTDVMVDESRIMQILTNLLNNALKFTSEGGEIIVKLGEDPKSSEYVQISVTDNGCGIPRDQIDNLFHRFYQIKKGDATPEKGVGLGLYLCREMVLLHGGNIWVQSALGIGSTFSFTIPKEAATKAAHVLIVDDDCNVRDTLQLLLASNGFDVVTVAGGSEALQQMSQKTPDVVVLDLMMGGLDGPSTLKEIRKNLGPIPVIVHTGYPDSDFMQRALESSPFTLLPKPCPPKRFVETVRRICHDNAPLPKEKNKCLPVTASAQRVKPFRERAPGAKIFTQVKQLLVAEDDKEVAAGIKASNGSGHPASIRTAQRRN
jgi:PAS domain S-box-containing protein